MINNKQHQEVQFCDISDKQISEQQDDKKTISNTNTPRDLSAKTKSVIKEKFASKVPFHHCKFEDFQVEKKFDLKK